MTDVYEKVHALRNVIFPLKTSEVLHKNKLFPRLIGVVSANVTNINVLVKVWRSFCNINMILFYLLDWDFFFILIYRH